MKRDLSLFLEDILVNINDIESFVGNLSRERLEINKLRTKNDVSKQIKLII